MTTSGQVAESLDFIEELRLRRWARENFVDAAERSKSWHPVVHDEMRKKEAEATSYAPVFASTTR